MAGRPHARGFFPRNFPRSVTQQPLLVCVYEYPRLEEQLVKEYELEDNYKNGCRRYRLRGT